MEQSLAENSRESELIERELLEIEVHTWKHIERAASCDCSYFKPWQPRMLNIQASIDARSTEMAKIQSKINKVEDEVWTLRPWELVHSLLNVTNNLSTVTLFNVCQVLGITKWPFLLMCVGSFWVAYIVYSHFLYFLSWQVFSDFCRSIGVTSIRSVRVAHGLCIITLVHCFLSLFSHTPHSPYPSLVFRSPSSSLSPFPSTPPPSHSFPLTPSQAIWGEAAKGPAGACPAETGVCQPGISSPEPTCLWETEGHYGYV